MKGTLLLVAAFLAVLCVLLVLLVARGRVGHSHPLDGEAACELCGYPISVYPRTVREAYGLCAYCGGFGSPAPRNPSPPFPSHVQEALDEALEEAAREALEEAVARTPAHREGEA